MLWSEMDGFIHLATGGCPPIADLMLAMAAEFRDVDPAAADLRLDELALPCSASPAATRASRPRAWRTSWTPTPASTPTARGRPPRLRQSSPPPLPPAPQDNLKRAWPSLHSL